MKILLLSYYYPPDIGPGANRALALTEALRKNFGTKLHLDILTTTPNRYSSYKVNALNEEKYETVYIKRFTVFRNIYEKLKYPLGFLIFYFKCLNYAKGKKYDLIIASSGRLMTAFLGAKLSQKLKTQLYLDIRDLFLENLNQVFENKVQKIFLPFARKIESYTINTAKHINIVSEGFLPYVKKNWSSKKISCYTNGVDELFKNKNIPIEKRNQYPTILYAGNIGYGQALHEIIPKAAKLLEDRARFLIIGDGNLKNKLADTLQQLNVSNVELMPIVSRDNLKHYYLMADFLFLNLNIFSSLETVIPSKIFEYASTGKPILAGVSGYARKFIHNNIKGCETFEPCNSILFEKAFNTISKGPTSYNRDIFNEQFSQAKIMNLYVREIHKTYKKN